MFLAQFTLALYGQIPIFVQGLQVVKSHKCQEACFSIMKPHLRPGILSRAQQRGEQQEGAALTSLEEHRDKLLTPQGAGLEVMCMRGLCSNMDYPPTHNQKYSMQYEILKEEGIQSH